MLISSKNIQDIIIKNQSQLVFISSGHTYNIEVSTTKKQTNANVIKKQTNANVIFNA